LISEQKKKEKKEKKEEKKEHTSSKAGLKAILNKSSSANYMGNFSYYARGDGKGRADRVYNKISPNISALYANRPAVTGFYTDYFKLSSVACNFNSKAKMKKNNSGASKPYVWKAHHMIPGEVFTVMESSTGTDEQIFNDIQYRLLLMSDYNINNGNNMIALPANRMDFFQPVHDLLQHPSSHSAYTNRVIKEMKKVSDELEELTDELEKPHPDVAVKIADDLKTLENKLWKLLINVGKASVTSIVKKQKIALNKEDQMLVKNQTENGKTQYPMGALG
jgi:hypothetical protein